MRTHLRDRARDLRKALTLSEQRLWQWLRNRAFCGYKFRRQVPVAHYILDFYCPELKLAVEVDGRQHELPCMVQYDDERSMELARFGIRVLRIANVVLANDAPMVAEQLKYAIGQRATEMRKTPHPALRATFSPRGGEKGD